MAFVVLLVAGAAGCSHEARVTGPSQCFAPQSTRVARASDIVRGHAELAARNAVDPARN